jgi:hypothetical protein
MPHEEGVRQRKESNEKNLTYFFKGCSKENTMVSSGTKASMMWEWSGTGQPILGINYTEQRDLKWKGNDRYDVEIDRQRSGATASATKHPWLVLLATQTGSRGLVPFVEIASIRPF